MKFKKSIIKEEIGLLGGLALALAVFAIKWYEDKFGHPNSKYNQPMPEKNVWDGLNSLFDKQSFVKDFAKILYDEGDFSEVEKAVKNREGHLGQLWIDVNAGDFNKNPIAKRIVQKIMQTADYKKVEKEYTFTKSDKVDAAKILYWFVISPKLGTVAQTFIKKGKTQGVLDKMLIGPVLQKYLAVSDPDRMF